MSISKEALARKKRYVQFKEDLNKKNLSADQYLYDRLWRLYFDDAGTIVCLTQEDVKPQKHWKTYEFTNEQLGVLTKRMHELHKYYIVKDSREENVYKIEIKPIESVYANAEKDFLAEITTTKTKNPEISVNVTETHLIVELNPAVIREHYSDIYPVSATIKGARLLKFFITAKGDPHILYHHEIISLSELIIDQKVSREMPADCRECSVYTIKHFDSYARL